MSIVWDLFCGAGGASTGLVQAALQAQCPVTEMVAVNHWAKAVATSAALGFPIALAGSLGYVLAGMGRTDLPAGALGFVYVPGLVSIALGSMLTAPLGARTAHRMDIGPLKKVFALFLYLMAAYFLFR